jgi:hypothetical protein
MKNNTTFVSWYKIMMIKKGHNRVHKLPFYEGGMHGFQPFPAGLDGIVQNQRSMVERGGCHYSGSGQNGLIFKENQ